MFACVAFEIWKYSDIYNNKKECDNCLAKVTNCNDQCHKMQRFLVFQSWLDEALVINHINASEDINFDWGRLLEDLHRWSQIGLPRSIKATFIIAHPSKSHIHRKAHLSILPSPGWTSTSPRPLHTSVAPSSLTWLHNIYFLKSIDK